MTLSFAKRNMKVFLRDGGSVMGSLLTVIIFIGVYALFLGDMMVSSIDSGGFENHAKTMADEWIMAGIVSVMPLSCALGAAGIIVEDRSKKIDRDFYCSPISRASVSGGYILSVFLIAFIMTVIGFALSQLYIVSRGGELLSLENMLKALGVILLDALAASAIIITVAMLFKSQNAYGSACTVIGTLSGFVMGLYLPVGSLPDAIATVVKCFPLSHSAVLLRQIFMEKSLEQASEGAPIEAVEILEGIQSELGVSISFGNHVVSAAQSVAVLAVTAAVFFGAAWLLARRKEK